LYEQAPELVEVGAGIVVAPNMVRLLRTLGLADALSACAVRLEAAWELLTLLQVDPTVCEAVMRAASQPGGSMG
jgi:2-polyprenyl-6-methoxyphenol hydroxylase-like FAD-dependent oxidoreductase